MQLNSQKLERSGGENDLFQFDHLRRKIKPTRCDTCKYVDVGFSF